MEAEKKKHSKNGTMKGKLSRKRVLLLVFVLVIVVIAVVIIVSHKKDKSDDTNSSNEGIKLYNTTLSEYVKETENGTRLNISTALNVDKKIGELNITEIQLTENGGITTLSAKVTNNTDKATSLKSIWAVFLDEDGKELYKARGVIGALDPYESTKLNISMSSSYITAYDIEFKE